MNPDYFVMLNAVVAGLRDQVRQWTPDEMWSAHHDLEIPLVRLERFRDGKGEPTFREVRLLAFYLSPAPENVPALLREAYHPERN